MSIVETLQTRSNHQCELCSATEDMDVYEVSPSNGSADECVYLCANCRDQIEHPDKVDVHHWHCLNDSMWSPTPAVQVMAWRMLNRLSAERWAQDLLDTLYLEEDMLSWAKASDQGDAEDANVKHIDSNGAALEAGDTVTLIKDLNVKGANFTAKRGTAVRGISLVADNPEHIEGRVSGQRIVILTKFVKKSG